MISRDQSRRRRSARRALRKFGAAWLSVAGLSIVWGSVVFAQAPPPEQSMQPQTYQSQAPQRDVEVMGAVGYQWGGTLNYSSGDIHINAAMNYGGSIGTMIKPGYFLELSYSYQGTKVIGRPRNGPDFDLFDVSSQYIFASGLKMIQKPGSKVAPYAIGGLGMNILSPGSSTYGNYDTQYLFAMNFGLGLKVQASPKVALRVQSRLLLPVNWVGGGVYFGSGGAGVGVSGGSSMPQGEATVGVSFKLGQ